MIGNIYVKTMILALVGLYLAGCTSEKVSRIQTQPTKPSQLEQSTTVSPAITVLATGVITPQPTTTSLPEIVLPDLGEAPDITNQVWLNTDQPLPLEAVRGKVTLVEFWTFG
jgi:hypothetical protein